jgi:hypothetical protein
MPMGVLKSKIRPWSLPQLFIAILLTHIIITLIHTNISNKGLLEECDKEENLEVTGAAATTSCLKRTPQNVFPKSCIRPVTARPAPQ